ncbi:MAG TPA: GDCCVxC domain-containing (seleno)protein [Dongiaceae bacterium]|nr:GDCCVxC domain-containing (seleno)protein [Dongiaceae bacterium]
MIELQSTITCPGCGFQAVETMPTDACQYFYECRGCGAILKPKTGDCCVFCSFGSMPCPPVQQEGGQQERPGQQPAASCCKPTTDPFDMTN